MENMEDKILQHTKDIVAVWMSSHSFDASQHDTCEFVKNVYKTLQSLVYREYYDESTPRNIDAKAIKSSIKEDYLVCLEDGRKFKSLKRHLKTQYNLTPDDYRKKWGLSHDYPMTAPAYAKQRSELAKSMGLGQYRKKNSK